jgi:hypothetical protein
VTSPEFVVTVRKRKGYGQFSFNGKRFISNSSEEGVENSLYRSAKTTTTTMKCVIMKKWRRWRREVSFLR